jgi:trehalose 6-phosphate phosphatase
MPEIDNSALFLDVDGTLLELQQRPDTVRSTEALNQRLLILCELLDNALALVSGRTIAALDTIFAPLRLPAAGAHGSELRLPDGTLSAAGHTLPEDILTRMQRFAVQDDGLLLELKPGGASLHYRQAPQLEKACRQFMQALTEELSLEFRLIDGKKVLELAPLGASKGEAIREFLHHAPFAGRRPVFIGDDVTDEDGFRVVNALGGMSILVGERDATEAGFVLKNVSAVHDWMNRLVSQ